MDSFVIYIIVYIILIITGIVVITYSLTRNRIISKSYSLFVEEMKKEKGKYLKKIIFFLTIPLTISVIGLAYSILYHQGYILLFLILISIQLIFTAFSIKDYKKNRENYLQEISTALDTYKEDRFKELKKEMARIAKKYMNQYSYYYLSSNFLYLIFLLATK